MNDNPYQSSDTVLVSSPEKVRRPALIWLTQVILIFVVLIQLLVLSAGVLSFLMPSSSATPPSDMFIVMCVSIMQISFASILFIGLARARKWSWYGGFIFSVLLMVFVFYSRANPPSFAPPTPPNQLLGAAIGELIVTVLIVLYPFRMYFSKKVRIFLGVV